MIEKLTFLKPNKEKLNLYMFLGALFFALGIYDITSNSFFDKNVTSFLPTALSFFTPLFF